MNWRSREKSEISNWKVTVFLKRSHRTKIVLIAFLKILQNTTSCFEKITKHTPACEQKWPVHQFFFLQVWFPHVLVSFFLFLTPELHGNHRPHDTSLQTHLRCSHNGIVNHPLSPWLHTTLTNMSWNIFLQFKRPVQSPQAKVNAGMSYCKVGSSRSDRLPLKVTVHVLFLLNPLRWL